MSLILPVNFHNYYIHSLHPVGSRDGPKFGRRRSSTECSARFGSATRDHSAEVRPNFGKHSASLGLRIGGVLRSPLALTKVNTLIIS